MLIRKLILCIMLGLMFSDTQSEQNQPLPLPNDGVCEELPIDIWIRPSNDEQNFGNLMYLDMSRGWSGTDGVNILLTNTTVAYNTVGSIFIDAGEMVILKLPATTINTIGAVSVTVTNGMPSADSSSAVLVKVATLMDDVG